MRTRWHALVLALALTPMSLLGQTRSALDPPPETGTFSILGFDQETGEIGAAVQSRVFSVGNGVLWAEAGVGIVATQATVDVGYGPTAMRLLKDGMAPKDIIKKVWDEDTNPGYRGNAWLKTGRQFAVMNPKGEFAAFTGATAPDAAADAQGPHSTAQGNTLGSKDVPAAMVKAFEESEKDAATGKRNHLAIRLVLAIEAGQAAGGDKRGQQSAALIVVKKDCGVWLHNDVGLHLQVDDSPEPIKELRRLVEKAVAPRSGQLPCYVR